MREFAEREIVIPNGPHEGRRFRCEYQPYSGLWFDAIDSGRWNRFVATGPVQSGKTLSCFAVPALYHLFGIGESIILGLPSMDTAEDKWKEDLLPVIERTRFRDLIPDKGKGSRGGRSLAIRFKNGATLRWMSGAGGDKSRASYTARVVIITETDGMDEAGSSSREADKITQLEARTKAFGDAKRVYMECTVSLETGRTWREYKAGTESRIALLCPHCSSRVTPEREHLVGWADAEDELEAKERAAWMCPECGVLWTREEQRQANRDAILLHRGQEAGADGEVVGAPPRTQTLGFRWSAANNLFLSPGDVGADEWRASRSDDEENAEKEMRQFVFALPYKPPVEEASPLNPEGIIRRVGRAPRGVFRPGALFATMGVDIGKHVIHWTLMDWLPGASGHVVDYGKERVESDLHGEERAILQALRDLRDNKIEAGWATGDGALRSPDLVIIDAKYKPAPVVAFCRESGSRYMPSMSYGATQNEARGVYSAPRAVGPGIAWIGSECHVARDSKWASRIMHANSDHWKSWLHEGLEMPAEASGAITLFQALPREHLPLARALTAEKRIKQWIPEKGMVVRWSKVRRDNHWLDSTYLSCLAAHRAGLRRLEAEAAKQPPAPPRPRFIPAPVRTPDGRPFLISERR